MFVIWYATQNSKGCNMKISVIIPVFDNQKELLLTLNSLSNQTFPKNEFEIIVSDDGSTTEMDKFVRKNSPENIKTRYFFQENNGFRPGTARNVGIRNALGNICVFVDSGVILEKNCLEAHYKMHEGHENLVVLGYIYGNAKNPNLLLLEKIVRENSVETAIAMLVEKGEEMLDAREHFYREFGDDLMLWPAPWVVLWSAHFSVRTLFMTSNNGFFDEYFNTWGGEDNDLGIVLQECGGSFKLCRSALSIHYPPKITSHQRLDTDEKFYRDFLLNKKYLLEKHKHNRSVRIWYEKNLFLVNQILLSDHCE